MNRENLLLFLGEEEYLIQQGLAAWLKKLLPDAEKDFNYQVFYGDDFSYEIFVNSACTWPFGSDRRVIAIKNIDDVNNAVAAKLVQFMQKEPPSFLWLVFTAKKLEEKNQLYQFIKNSGKVVACDPWPESKKTAWVMEQGRRMGLDLTLPMVRYILSESNLSMIGLMTELQKLALYQKAKQEKITMEDLYLLIHGESSETVFSLCDAIAKKQTLEVFRILENLHLKGEAEANIVGLLSKQYRQMLAAKIILQDRGNADYLAQKIGIHPYAAKIACTQSRLFSFPELVRGIEKMAAYDDDVKTGKYSAQRGLELLLLGLIEGYAGSRNNINE